MKTSDLSTQTMNTDKNTSPLFTATEFKRIFLISHMRANTSLISHILGSHPQISGYYEMHLSYTSKQDFQKQEALLFKNSDLKNKIKQAATVSNTRYLFDKLLHNKYELMPENLVSQSKDNNSSEQIKILVSIRPAEQTIKSIINLFRHKKEPHPYAEPINAIEYYLQRIKNMAQFCEKYKNRYYYYDADLIRKDSENSLNCLQTWLSLETPLSEHYQVFSMTGRARMGDSSDNMTKGHIVKQQSDYDTIELPNKLLQQAQIESKHYRQLIIKNSIHSLTS